MFVLAAIASLLTHALPTDGVTSSVVQPAHVASADGRWTLDVDPSRRDGEGAANYVARHDGAVAWSGMRPWTLLDVLVADSGHVAGAALHDARVDEDGEGDLRLVVLDPRGASLRDEVLPRASWSAHSTPTPVCRGIVALAEPERVLFRIGRDCARGVDEEWRVVDVTNGADVFRAALGQDWPSDEHDSNAARSVRTIPGTPLLLAECRRFEWPKLGVRFVVADERARCVASIVAPNEGLSTRYEQPRTPNPVEAYMDAQGLVLDVGVRRFSIARPSLGERVDYAVEPEASAALGWRVSELARAPWAVPAPPDSERLAFADLRLTELEELARVQLPIAPAPADSNPLHDIAAFDVARDGTFAVVVPAEPFGTFELLRLDAAGELVARAPIPLPGFAEHELVEWHALGELEFLALQAAGPESRVASCRFDARTGTSRAFASFEGWLECAQRTHDGGVFALVRVSLQRSHFALVCVGSDAQTRWRVDTQPFEAGAETASAIGVAVSAAVAGPDRCVLLERDRPLLHVLDGAGARVETFDLSQLLGDEAGEPLSVGSAGTGELLVRVARSDAPPLWRLDVATRVRTGIETRSFNDCFDGELDARVRCTSDGALWACDANRLYRLDADGIIGRIVGGQRDPNALVMPTGGSIDVLGRALVQDEATGAIHVFDALGQRQFVALARPGEVPERYSTGFSARHDGGVRAWPVEFDAHGVRVRSCVRDDVWRRDSASAAITLAVGDPIGANAAVGVLDGAGKLVRVHERRLDGRWLERTGWPGIACDGRAAVSTEEALVVLAEGGHAQSELPLPRSCPGVNVAVGRSWALLHDSSQDAALVDLDTGRVVRVRADVAEEGSGLWGWGFTRDGRDVLSLDIARGVLVRLATPR